jgi:hypothetical protein
MIFLVISLLDDKPPASNDNPERGPYPTPIQMSKHKPNHRMTTIHFLTPEPESTLSPSLFPKFKPSNENRLSLIIQYVLCFLSSASPVYL